MMKMSKLLIIIFLVLDQAWMTFAATNTCIRDSNTNFLIDCPFRIKMYAEDLYWDNSV